MPNPRFCVRRTFDLGRIIGGWSRDEADGEDDLALATVIARKGRAGMLAERVQARSASRCRRPKRAAAGKIAFIGTGPGQWLAIEEASADPQAFAARLATEFAGDASVSDQIGRRAVIAYQDRAPHVLAKGLPVDLHPRAFGPGDAALSQVALIGAHLWQIERNADLRNRRLRDMAAIHIRRRWRSANRAKLVRHAAEDGDFVSRRFVDLPQMRADKGDLAECWRRPARRHADGDRPAGPWPIRGGRAVLIRGSRRGRPIDPTPDAIAGEFRRQPAAKACGSALASSIASHCPDPCR